MVVITVSRAMRMVAVNRLITLLMVGMFIAFAANRYFLIPLLASLIIAVFLRSMLRCPNCGRNVYLKRMKASGTMPERDYNSGSMVDERMASRAVPDCYRADRSHHCEHGCIGPRRGRHPWIHVFLYGPVPLIDLAKSC